MSSETGQIYELIPKIMGDIGHIAKDGFNEFHKYPFRGIDAVYNHVGPKFAKYGVFPVPKVINTDIRTVKTKNGEGVHAILTVKYEFTAPDGSHIDAITVGESIDTGDKAVNKAMSSAMKYAVWQTLCIPTKGEQGDVEDDTPELAPSAPPQQPPAQKPNPVQEKVKRVLGVFGKDLCAKAKLNLIKPDGSMFTAEDPITRMGEINELERILNTGEVT